MFILFILFNLKKKNIRHYFYRKIIKKLFLGFYGITKFYCFLLPFLIDKIVNFVVDDNSILRHMDRKIKNGSNRDSKLRFGALQKIKIQIIIIILLN